MVGILLLIEIDNIDDIIAKSIIELHQCKRNCVSYMLLKALLIWALSFI